MQQIQLEQKSSYLTPVPGGIAALHNTLLALHNRLEALEQKLQSLHSAHKRKLCIKTGKSHEILNIDKIVRCEASNNYTYIFLADGSNRFISKSLKAIEGELPANIFIRCHQSHLVNIKYIQKVHLDDSLLTLSDNTNVSVSRSRKEALRNVLNI